MPNASTSPLPGKPRSSDKLKKLRAQVASYDAGPSSRQRGSGGPFFQQARRATCLLSVALLALQTGLYLRPSSDPRGVLSTLEAVRNMDVRALRSEAASIADRVSQGVQGRIRTWRGADEPASSPLPLQLPPYPPSPPRPDAAVLASPTNISQSLPSSTGTVSCAAGGKQCVRGVGDFPRNRILIIHEQHLQSMGCDVRLLRFIKDLLYLNQEVSMFFRASTPLKMRQPKSKQLANILHIQDFEEDQLRSKVSLREPPGLYEWTNSERFGQLMAKGYFNVVIIFLWFWYDPQPSVAELVLPLIRAHAPPDRQPFVSLLCDDAHAIRSSRLGEVEIHPSTREGYNDRARNYWIRQKNMYRLVDMVMYISPMDQVAEKESYPFVPYFRLSRMPIRAFRILSKSMPAPMQERSFLRTANIGFIGNGLTPTNHLGIQWYLEHCWADVRRQLPGVRMRLIGRPPGERTVKGQQVPCVRTEDAHCGWAWGTVYSGAEAQSGVDEMGYLSAEGLLEEVLSWRLMIVPVLRTTGVNTKILVALELGVPLVITPVAASPFDFNENETIVAFASEAADFVQQTVQVYTVSYLWNHLSRSSRQHWENLAAHDPARNDVRNVLSTVCQGTNAQHYLKSWEAPPLPSEPTQPTLVLPPAKGAKPLRLRPRGARSKSFCFNGGNYSQADGPPVAVVGAHWLQHMFPQFNTYVSAIWKGICQQCKLVCKQRQDGSPYDFTEADVFLDFHWVLPLERLDPLVYRLAIYSWDPGKMGRFFHYSGNLLEGIGATERVVAESVHRPNTSMTIRINQEMRNSGGFIYNWRKVLNHFGMSKPAINKIIEAQVSKVSANWTKEIMATMTSFKAG